MYFKTTKGKTVSLQKYIPNMIQTDPGCRIYIGTDSQNYSRATEFATVVAFRYSFDRGVHFVYLKKSQSPKIKDIKTRLRKEAEMTIELAWKLQSVLANTKFIVEFDINKKPTEKSNGVFTEVVGWSKGMGFETSTKPEELVAIRAANVLC